MGDLIPGSSFSATYFNRQVVLRGTYSAGAESKDAKFVLDWTRSTPFTQTAISVSVYGPATAGKLSCQLPALAFNVPACPKTVVFFFKGGSSSIDVEELQQPDTISGAEQKQPGQLGQPAQQPVQNNTVPLTQPKQPTQTTDTTKSGPPVAPVDDDLPFTAGQVDSPFDLNSWITNATTQVAKVHTGFTASIVEITGLRAPNVSNQGTTTFIATFRLRSKSNLTGPGDAATIVSGGCKTSPDQGSIPLTVGPLINNVAPYLQDFKDLSSLRLDWLAAVGLSKQKATTAVNFSKLTISNSKARPSNRPEQLYFDFWTKEGTRMPTVGADKQVFVPF